MAKIKDKLIYWMMYFSAKEKQNRDFSRYHEQVKQYDKYTDEQIECLYVNAKTECEHRKVLFNGLAITFFLTLVTGWWKWVYHRFRWLYLHADTFGSHLYFIQDVLSVLAFVATLAFIWLLFELSSSLKHSIFRKNILEEQRRMSGNLEI